VMRVLAPLAAVAMASALLIAGETEAPHKAPELAFNIPGQGQKLLSQYRGKVVALSFIWTTCPHCQAESKLMTKLQQEYGPRGFQALDIAINDNADLLVENFSKEFQVNFPVGWALKTQMISFRGWTSEYYVVPQLLLIDRKGYVRYETPQREDETWDKLMKEDAIRQHIEELLGQANATSHSHAANTRIALAKKTS